MDLTFGARLRSQRERQQVALATIAEETKISVALLEGLERDDVSRWPGGLFRRAYVRAYAQKIGLDPEAALRDFLQAYPDPAEQTSPVEAIAQSAGESKRPRTRLGFLIAGLAGLRAQAAAKLPTPVFAEAMAAFAATPSARPHSDSRLPKTPEVLLSERSDEEDASFANVDQVEVQADTYVLPLVDEVHTATASATASEETATAPRPPARLVVVPSVDSGAETRRELRTLERNVALVSRLCTRIACARDERDITDALEDCARILGAQGAILWAWDPDRSSLCPALSYGYPEELVRKLPLVPRAADNAIAAAFRSGQKRVVRGTASDTGALVVPLLTLDGCAGALALEFSNGSEQHELSQALATIIAAQLSTLFAGMSRSAIDEETWQHADESLVAS